VTLACAAACRGGGGGGSTRAASTAIPRFAYVANEGDHTVSVYSVDAATGLLRHRGYARAGAAPRAVAVDGAGKFVYVANNASNDVSAYSVDAATGALTPVAGSPFAAGDGPQAIVVDGAGRFVYVTSSNPYAGTSSVSAYTVAASGALTPVAGGPFVAGAYPYGVTLAPNGRFAYVADGGNGVSAYTVNATTGALVPVVGSPFAAGNGSYFVTVDPTSRFAYVANGGGGTISVFAIDAATGALTLAGNATATDGLRIITVAPSGRFLYVANENAGQVAAFAVDATTGALSAVPGSPFAAGSNTYSVVVDPSGTFAYATNRRSGTVSIFRIDPTTGALSALPPVAARSGAVGMAITRGTSTVRDTPRFAYAANNGPGSVVSAYTIDAATGALTALADTPTLALATAVAVDPSGRFAYTTHDILLEGPARNVSTYTVGASGALTRVGAAAAVASNPSGVAVEPSGRFAYVANQGSNDVSMHAVDATTGALSWMGSVVADDSPSALAVDPSGRFVYVANGYASNPGSGSLTAYAIAADSGALSAIDLNGAGAGTALVTGPNPTGVTVDPSGRFVYVTHANGVQSYEIQLTDGAQLAAGALINASAATAGADPRAVAVDPSGRFAYVANHSASASAFRIDARSGVLTGAGTVAAGAQPRAVAIDPSGRFAYVANAGSSDISIFALDAATGALTQAGAAAAGSVPVALTITGTVR
jgi:6-phosphogluconolactonase (cycloisomerase 2 family)